LEKLQSWVPQTEHRIETLLGENSQLKLQIAELRQEKEKGGEKIQQLEKELKRLPELSQAIGDLRNTNSGLEAQLENMKASLRQKIESQLAGLQELHHQLENSVQPEKGL
jgi:predicted  nucleic acid-binding Zn-ribbon protein